MLKCPWPRIATIFAPGTKLSLVTDWPSKHGAWLQFEHMDEGQAQFKQWLASQPANF